MHREQSNTIIVSCSSLFLSPKSNFQSLPLNDTSCKVYGIQTTLPTVPQPFEAGTGGILWICVQTCLIINSKLSFKELLRLERTLRTFKSILKMLKIWLPQNGCDYLCGVTFFFFSPNKSYPSDALFMSINLWLYCINHSSCPKN